MNRLLLVAALCSLNTGCGLWIDAFAPRPESDVGMDAGPPDASVPIDVDIARDARIAPDVAPDTGRCATDSDCVALDDACNSGRCVSEMCVRMPDHEGAACEDATGCFTGMCLAGECDAHPRNCMEFDSVCTVGACAAGSGCFAMSRPPTVECEDGDFCSWDDGCRMGACAGITTDCGVRADVIPRAMTLPYGNRMAPPFADTCPEGQVMIGFQAGLASDYWFGFTRRYSMLCGVVHVTTDAMPTLSITPGATLPLEGHGISPGGLEARMCPPGHVVVGVEGGTSRLAEMGSLQYLSELRIRCAPLSAVSDGPGRAHVLVGAPIVTATTLGTLSEVAVPAVDCPAGTVAMGSLGHADEILDSLGLRCGSVVLTETTTAPSPGMRVEADLFRDDCPYGHVPVGLRADLSTPSAGLYDRNLTQLETLCAPITLTGAAGTWTTTVGAPIATHAAHGTRTGTSAVMRVCGPNQVVIGYSGDGGAAMTRVVLRCARVMVSGGIDALGFSHGAVTSLAPIGVRGDVPFGSTECPSGTVGSGFFGSASEVVSDLALRCAAPTLVGR